MERSTSYLHEEDVKARRQMIPGIAEAAVLGSIDRNPGMAAAELEEGRYDAELPKPVRDRLLARADTALEGELRLVHRQVRGLMEDHLAAVLRGEPGIRDIATRAAAILDPTEVAAFRQPYLRRQIPSEQSKE